MDQAYSPCEVTEPSGRKIDLGSAPFKGKKGEGPTTGDPRFLAWQPSGHGRHIVDGKGVDRDKWGNRYEWGGTYPFWIANRMTMATATFQGMSFPVGSTLWPGHRFLPRGPRRGGGPCATSTRSPEPHGPSPVQGRASEAGIFGVPQGMKPFPSMRRESTTRAYWRVTKTVRARSGCAASATRASSTPGDAPFRPRQEAEGGRQFVDLGETGKEGYIEPGETSFRHLEHIAFPYRSGDVLLIASEGQGANKIEPVLTYELPGEVPSKDQQIQAIGADQHKDRTRRTASRPISIPNTSRTAPTTTPPLPGPVSPHASSLPRTACRHLTGPRARTNFGGQIGASPNGDSPGDIYRLVGGVVVRPKDTGPLYAGYLSSAFILPAGTRKTGWSPPARRTFPGRQVARAGSSSFP